MGSQALLPGKWPQVTLVLEGQTGYWGKRLHGKVGQALEQTAQESGWVPIPGSVQKHMDVVSGDLGSAGGSWTP